MTLKKGPPNGFQLLPHSKTALVKLANDHGNAKTKCRFSISLSSTFLNFSAVFHTLSHSDFLRYCLFPASIISLFCFPDFLYLIGSFINSFLGFSSSQNVESMTTFLFMLCAHPMYESWLREGIQTTLLILNPGLANYHLCNLGKVT